MIGPGKVSSAIRVATLAIAAALLVPVGASATVTSQRVNIDEDAIMTGNAAGDTIVISSSGGLLSHNRFDAGDPGFFSAQDFDTTDAGDQTIANGVVNNVFLDAGDGNDTLQVGLSPSSPASTIAATIGVQGQGDTDTLIVDDFSDSTGRTVEPSISGFSIGTGFGGGRIDYPSFDIESMLLLFGSGNDTARIAPATPITTSVAMNTGDDTIRFASGASMDQGQAQMGPGVDTLDYSPRTDDITVSPPNGRSFSATINGAQEVPPNPGTPAAGLARATINSTTNQLTSFGASVFGITTNGPGPTTPTMLTDAHIHGPAAPGADAGILFMLGTTGWATTQAPGMTRFDTSNQAITQPTEDAMLAGLSYINLHTNGTICGPAGNTTCSGGEIRGQLIPDGFTANATGTRFAEGFENVTGGSGNDQLSGTPVANTISGGSGNDVIDGAEGNDTLTGGDGADTMQGGPDDDLLQAAGGAADADTALGCGTGNDSVNRDAPPTDPDSIVNADCETVNPPLAGSGGGGGGDADGDGVPDATDVCPAQSGPASNNGCPLPAVPPDGDGDGVPDASDTCPAQAGPASNSGCPVTPSKPDNDIEIGKAKLNTKKGTAKLPVEVPGAGELELSGKSVKPVDKQVSGPGTVNLPVKPKGKLDDKLDDKGKAKVTLEVTFTPAGGDSNTESTKVTLKEK